LNKAKICLNTQTPLVQFLSQIKTNDAQNPTTPDLSSLVEGVDFQYSTGGVTRMVYPLISQMIRDGTISDAHWISLNSSGPESIKANGITFHNVILQKDRLKNYGVIKEAIWGTVHGINGTTNSNDIFWSDDFADYAFYNRYSAELMKKLDNEHDFDIFYIHDFQQLPVGHMLNTLKPKVYRWHIPFDKSMIPDEWRELLATYFNSYDVIIVSSGKYLDSLKALGFKGQVKKIYPYVNPNDYSVPSAMEIMAVSQKLGIREKDEIVLIVARMDPMKAQDRAILAFASIAKAFPSLKLVCVGNGSFSSSTQGANSKSALWRKKLEDLTKKLELQDRVIFAGHLSQNELDAMYERCSFTMLPSVNEGFGLVVVESWIHHKAALVTERAGVADLIEDEKNGMLYDPENVELCAKKMSKLLVEKELARKMGNQGHKTSKLCSIDAGLKAEREVIEKLLE